MSFSFHIFKHATALRIFPLGAGLSGLLICSASARPIEFSEPANSNLTSQVSSLGEKPSNLPGVEDRIFKPYSYHSPRDFSYGMKRQPARPAPGNSGMNNLTDAFGQSPDGARLSPDKLLMKQLEREAFNLPAPDFGDNSAAAWSAWDPTKLKPSRRDNIVKGDFRNSSPETNGLNNAGDIFSMGDPFAGYSGRRSWPQDLGVGDSRTAPLRDFSDVIPGENSFSPEGVERKRQMDHLDHFKRALNILPGGLNPVRPATSLPSTRGNAYLSDSENSTRSALQSMNPGLTAPVAPFAPQGPLAPEQTSLTPAPYTPPAKLKPAIVTAPRRSF